MFFSKKKKKAAETKPVTTAQPVEVKVEEPKAAKVEKKPKQIKAPEPAASKPAKEATRVYHVAKREDGKWAVKFSGGEKAIKLFDTQKEAMEYTKKMAENQNGAMLVHNSKGANKGRIKKK